VQRLHDAGAVLIAKLSLGALAPNDIGFGGQTMNPWLIEEGASGSSAGPAAAAAAGLVGFSIGSETLGSIVSPSMRCGVTGLRPTFGRVPRTGAMTLCWSLDKLGPMARAVEDTLLVLSAISGPDAGDLSSVPGHLDFDAGAGVRGLRVDFVQADRLRRKVAQEMARVFGGVDLLLVPSLRDEILTITNFTGHPSLTLRAGFVQVDRARSDWAPDPAHPLPTFSPPRRVPHGVTLIGRLFEEGTLGRAGIALERAFGVASERPAGF